MNSVRNFLTQSRNLAIIGLILIAGFLFLGASVFKVALFWVVLVLALMLSLVAALGWVKRRRAKKASEQMGEMLDQQAAKAALDTPVNKRAEVEALRQRLSEAIKTIKQSKLGQVSGATALYELPWYMIIGNPAAGKSTAVVNSGLQFPFADKGTSNIIQGIGGTRNCDWFFTTEGILLDTAGRYSVHEEDREEWLGFLGLLKKYRPKAPINGIIIAASIAEVGGNRPEYAINLAKNLRQRVQELTEKLEVFAPVYIVFTKADLIAGFSEFFQDNERGMRDRVWGASLPFQMDGKNDALSQFDEKFDELYQGLKEMSVAQMALARGDDMPPGLLAFPMEFASIKPGLRAFIATLFEDNPFQFKPVFRGFYLTSALQEGGALSSSGERIVQRFGLSLEPKSQSKAHVFSRHGFFLRDLFSKVIFADKDLVRQYASRNKLRWRLASFLAAVLLFGGVLGGWSWSYIGNRQLLSHVEADLQKVIKLQDNRVDLQSRLEAMEILQDRIEQLSRYRENRPLSLSLGLYQGHALESKLRDEYYAGLREVMLKPVALSIESFLAEVNANAGQLQPMTKAAESIQPNSASVAAGPYKEASSSSVEDAYNALKTYLMLGDKERVEAGHLADQIARHWRGWLETNRGNMSREQMIRSAERMISFYLARINDEDWPLTETRLATIDQTRENLRSVVRGMPARDRVYADIKARASTRFAPVSVARLIGDQAPALIAGSHAIAGTFTKEAWDGYVEKAIKEAANNELQSSDWVLKTAIRDDLTLEGSPEQIQKVLTQMYKEEYTREWQRFMQGITMTNFQSFDQAVAHMNRLGDPQNSPLNKLVTGLYDQTAWDNPSLVNAGLQRAQRGFMEWFRQTILRQSPAGVDVNINTSSQGMQIPMGPIGKEFSALARLMVAKDQDRSLMRGYMDHLSKIRTRFNQLKTQGDPGPGARQLMIQTLDGNGSELADALRFVDEQMLVGMTDTQKQTLRPLLVRPLMQAYAVVVGPVETELNKIWNAQVFEPFQRGLASKYPFMPDSRVEASAAEIAQIFGTDGAISKFTNSTLGPLVVRRGDIVTTRTWADMGVQLLPEFSAQVGRWMATSSAGASAGAAAQDSQGQTVFQIQPLPAPGTIEYTIEIDGQVLRYRNTPSQWTNFVWPNPQGNPGARITATGFDGKSIDIANHTGRFGLEKLINSAQRKRKDQGAFELMWTQSGLSVAIDLRIISSPQVNGDGSASGGTSPQGQGLRGVRLPSSVVGNTAAAPVRSEAGVTP
jgi:type VI secretion system protein ImpL